MNMKTRHKANRRLLLIMGSRIALTRAGHCAEQHRRLSSKRYSPDMSEPFVDDGFEERWAAWQARGAANDRNTRRKMFVVAAILVLAAAILNAMWWF